MAGGCFVSDPDKCQRRDAIYVRVDVCQDPTSERHVLESLSPTHRICGHPSASQPPSFLRGTFELAKHVCVSPHIIDELFCQSSWNSEFPLSDVYSLVSRPPSSASTMKRFILKYRGNFYGEGVKIVPHLIHSLTTCRDRNVFLHHHRVVFLAERAADTGMNNFQPERKILDELK